MSIKSTKSIFEMYPEYNIPPKAGPNQITVFRVMKREKKFLDLTDNVLLLETLKAAFPGAVGLKYKTDQGVVLPWE